MEPKNVLLICLQRNVGQPILAAAGFQPAIRECADTERAAEKGGCRQDCLPHDAGLFATRQCSEL
jgi:hypothetical protein